ncbi:MAG: hypothetical protein M5U34_44505 [Chloroflexi bacterium]|nr:hypothetical protein [Chloroflexota bacterium]
MCSWPREEGESIVQAFHPSLAQRRRAQRPGAARHLRQWANTNGGTI